MIFSAVLPLLFPFLSVRRSVLCPLGLKQSRSVLCPLGLKQSHSSFIAWAVSSVVIWRGLRTAGDATYCVVCVCNIGHTDGLRPLVSVVAVIFNKTKFSDLTVNTICVHNLRVFELLLKSQIARSEHIVFCLIVYIAGARWGTALQAGSIPDGTRNISWGKGSRCVGLTTLPPSCTDCLEIWEPQIPGTLRACPGL